jgi:glycosyltransferase involved in cell wall biosynthesis
MPLRRTWDTSAARAALSLRSFIRREKVDIVHTFFETADLWGGAVARLSGVHALISSRRDMAILRSRKHRLAYKAMGRFYTRVLTVSDAVRNLMIDIDGLSESKVVTLHTGVQRPAPVSSAAVAEARRRIGIPESAPLVLAVAHILPWKGHRELLQAASLVHAVHPEAHFAVAGAPSDAALAAELCEARKASGLEDCFHYLGPVAHTAPLYAAASVVCLLSSSEGLPNTLLEAMAAGRPVVATDVGGTREVVDDGVTGYLVRHLDIDSAAQRLCDLLSSPRLAAAMSAAALNRAESLFSMERMMTRLEGIYDASLA